MTKARAQTATTRTAAILEELEDWRAHAVPDAGAPLDADDVARLVRDCFASLGMDAEVARSFSVNTVHYYRRKDILDEPDGRTSAARYSLRHVWQAGGARLAGFLGLLTLAEARRQMRAADDAGLVEFVAERVADARGRQATREAHVSSAPRPLRATPASAHISPLTARALPPTQYPATVFSLGDNATCFIPSTHPALSSRAAARTLVETLATALGLDS
jgi:hypothetical protein